MTLQDFETNLKTACPDLVYELAAPKAAKRAVVWNVYGRTPVIGDDRNQLTAPKVQIDIFTQTSLDLLVNSVTDALWDMNIPYSVESEGYDPEYCCRRTILHLVVL